MVRLKTQELIWPCWARSFKNSLKKFQVLWRCCFAGRQYECSAIIKNFFSLFDLEKLWMPTLIIARSKFNNLVSTAGTVAAPIKYSSKCCSNFQRHRHMQAWGRSLQWYWSNDRLEIDDIINDLDERGWTRESECVRESVSGWDCVYVN